MSNFVLYSYYYSYSGFDEEIIKFDRKEKIEKKKDMKKRDKDITFFSAHNPKCELFFFYISYKSTYEIIRT